MKAVVYHQYSKSSDVLEFTELPVPLLKPNQVLVRNIACGINPKDVAIRKGYMQFITGKNPFPLQTGYDSAGIVEAIGDKVTQFKKGDAVFGYIERFNGGAASEFIAISENHIAHKPDSLTFEEAASMPCTYLTALQSLRDIAKIKKDEKLLLYGASGGVGTAAMQLAKVLGVSTTTVSSSKNLLYCLRQGADEAISYEGRDIFAAQKKFDVFFQIYLKDNLYQKSLPLLNKSGRFLSLSPGPHEQLLSLRTKLFFQKRFHAIIVRARQNDLTYLANLAKDGFIKPKIAEIIPIERIREAHDKVGALHTQGKIVIKVSDY